MKNAIVIGKRRYTCLSPTLVRIEFVPDGKFENRRSMVAHEKQAPIPFAKIDRKPKAGDGGHDLVLETGALSIHARGRDDAFSRLNLEIRWCDGKLVQFWRPGDRDYQNLGGTVRSLDRYGGECCVLDGVHPATMDSPDPSGTSWPAWIQCEVDPLYDPLHPKPPPEFNRGHWLREAARERNDGRYLERTFNWYKDSRRFCAGVLSASGYFLLNDSDGAVLEADGFPVERNRPGYQDWYVFAYGKNYKQALADFRLLSGPVPVPTHKGFGIIFSRWPAFTEAEVETMSREFAANGYPLSTLVMDMEWHKEGWGHWEFNPELIPDPKRFFALCRKHGLDVTFNDHPLDVRDDDVHYEAYLKKAGPDVWIRERDYNTKKLKMAKVDICNKQQNKAFCETCHTHILDMGLDYWWNDGSRGQLSQTAGQLVTNKTFFEESERDGRRGMLLARYGGLGSQRYGIFFTGDTTSDYDVLRLQCEFNIRAAGVGLSSISHDIGGFCLSASQVKKNKAGVPVIDAERYLRWLQFGVFNPILRFHSAPGCGSRRPDDYDVELNGACRHWLRIRHSLLPYLYTAAHTAYKTGIPICRGLFLEEPENQEAYRFDEYFFGPDLLVAPVLAAARKRSVYLPAGLWWEFQTGKRQGGGVEITRPVGLNDVPVYARAGSVIPRQDPDGDIHAAHVANLVLDAYAGADGGGELVEDDGRSPDYKKGAFCKSRFELKQTVQAIVLSGTVAEGKPLGRDRRITIELSCDRLLKKALMNGKPVKVASCGPNRFRLELPPIKASDKWEVRIS